MSGTDVVPAIPAIIGELTGPLLLGHLFNWGLFGVLTVQVYIYYLAFPRDRDTTKLIVASMYVIELLQTVLSTRDAFRVFGTGWGNMTEMNTVGWLWFSVPVLGSLMSCLAQLFYSWRIWILGRNRWTCGSIVLVSLTQCGAGLYSGWFAHSVGDFGKIQTGNYRIVTVWLGGTALCDVIVAVAMIYYLLKNRTGIRQTTTLITKFITLSIETGASCAILAIIDLALFLVYQHNNFHLAPSIALSKLYSNSLLVVFNARVRLVGGRNSEDTTLSGSVAERYLSDFAAAECTSGMNLTRPSAVAISQNRTTSVQIDLSRETYPMGTLSTRADQSSVKKKDSQHSGIEGC